MYGYIYIVTNLINGKIYIGRKKKTFFMGNDYLGSGSLIRAAVHKYGKKNFTVDLLEECQSKDELNNREQY